MNTEADDIDISTIDEDARGHPRNRTRKLWIVNQYASAPHKTGGGGRHFHLARWLGRDGWSTTVIGSTTVHPSGTQAFKGLKGVRRRSESGVNCVWVWSNSYKTGGVLRAIGMAVFTIGALLPWTTRRSEPPDVVLGSTVHLLAAWAGLRLARRHRVPFVYEIRDLWPETLNDLGTLKSTGRISRAMKQFSLHLARQSALVISPLPGVDKYLAENNLSIPFSWIPNGTDEALVTPDRATRGRPSTSFNVMYLGSHGRANALDTLLKAFNHACDLAPNADLVLRLVGSGPAKASLQALARRLSHGNRIFFEDRIPRSCVNSRAREADCLIVNLLDRPIYRYGISLNKLYDYLLAARPVIIASNALNDPVREAKAGISVPAEDLDEIANAIVKTYQMDPGERARMGQRGQAYVLEKYSYKSIATRLRVALEKLT